LARLFFFSSLSLVVSGEKRRERDLIPILFPNKREKREKKERKVSFWGEKSNNEKEENEGRQTATAGAAKDD